MIRFRLTLEFTRFFLLSPIYTPPHGCIAPIILLCQMSVYTLFDGHTREKQSPKTLLPWDRFVRLIGIEPTHVAPEATALSTELQARDFLLLLLKQDSASTLYTISFFRSDFK